MVPRILSNVGEGIMLYNFLTLYDNLLGIEGVVQDISGFCSQSTMHEDVMEGLKNITENK